MNDLYDDAKYTGDNIFEVIKHDIGFCKATGIEANDVFTVVGNDIKVSIKDGTSDTSPCIKISIGEATLNIGEKELQSISAFVSNLQEPKKDNGNDDPSLLGAALASAALIAISKAFNTNKKSKQTSEHNIEKPQVVGQKY